MALYLASRKLGASGPLELLSEAELLRIVLVAEGFRGAIHEEKQAKHSLENCTKSHPILCRKIPDIDNEKSLLGVVQCPTQRFRSLATAISVFKHDAKDAFKEFRLKCRIAAALVARIDLATLPGDDQVIEVFRLVGLRPVHRPAAGFEGELLLVNNHYSEYLDLIPSDVQEAFTRAKEAFDDLIERSEDHWRVIAPGALRDDAKDT